MTPKQKSKNYICVRIGVFLFQRPPNYEVDTNFRFNPINEPELAEEIAKKVAYTAGFFDVRFTYQCESPSADDLKNGLHYSFIVIELHDLTLEEVANKIKLATTKLVSPNYEAFYSSSNESDMWGDPTS